MLSLLPGTLLLFGIGFLGKLLESLGTILPKRFGIPFPHIEYVLWAIIVGLLFSNIFTIPKIFRPGFATYELWLKLGIVLIGARFVLSDLLHIGGLAIGLVFVELALSLTVMTLLGRIFGLNPKLTSLLAMGSSICGVTAIMAAQGAIEPDEEDTSTAIAAILALGALALFTFPAIGHMLHMGQQSYGIWSGLAVDNTAEATVTGALYGEEAGKYAILAKTARSAFIGFVVLGYAVYWASKGQAQRVDRKALFLWQKFPKFILGFMALSVLATVGFFSKGQLNSLGNLSKWFFLPAFAGVGLRTNLRDLVDQGWRPIVVGVLGEIFIALLTLGLVILSFHGAAR
ncbi:MAG: putative sulfate exporter family transporter [Acidobacteriaceae bacterium]|nr:putative sulfate exporter family transporter [Acidobacteriaceae bacterium]